MGDRNIVTLTGLIVVLSLPLLAQRPSADIEWIVRDNSSHHTRLAISPDSKHVATTSSDQVNQDIRVYAIDEGELSSGGELESVIPFGAVAAHYNSRYVRYWQLAFSSNNTLLVSLSFSDSGNKSFVFGLANIDMTDKTVQEFKRYNAYGYENDYRGGVYAYQANRSGGIDTFEMFNLQSGDSHQFLSRQEVALHGGVRLVALSEDGSVVVLRQNEYFWLIETATGEIIAEQNNTYIGEFKKALLLPDHQSILIFGYVNTLDVFNVVTGTVEHRVVNGNLFTQRTEDIALSPGGKYAATASDDGIIHLWNLQTGEEEYRYEDYQGYYTDLEFTPDGERLITLTYDGALISWYIPSRIKSSDNVNTMNVEEVERYSLSTNITLDREDAIFRVLFNLPKRSDVQVDLYNLRGERVAGIPKQTMEGGEQYLELNAKNLPDGLYLYKVESGEGVGTGRLIVQ